MTLEKLQHGKALTKANFPKFVETFNAMVDFMQNIKGDYDQNGTQGHIEVDKDTAGGPVIRFMGATNLSSSGGVPFTLSVLTDVVFEGGELVKKYAEVEITGSLLSSDLSATIPTEPWTGAPTPFPNVNE